MLEPLKPFLTSEPNAQLTRHEQRFAEEYLLDLDPAAAAQRAGLPTEAGWHLLNKRNVKIHLRTLRDHRSSLTEIYAADVLSRWWLLATADPNEVVQLRRVNCRYCHGINFGYQRTAGEMERDLAAHQIAADKANRETAPFDQRGGEGFNVWGDPHPDCPECAGIGEPRVYVPDSRSLSLAGRALYASVEQDARGNVKVNLRNQEAALLNVAKHLGMHIDRKEVSGPQGEPLEIVVKVVRPAPMIEGEVIEGD